LLIENEVNRKGCIDIIKAHGLPEPRKSGCFICPFQRKADWKELRRKHPDLFCMAVSIERDAIRKRSEAGKKTYFLSADMPLTEIVEERQGVLFEQDEYPPCLCGL
jgi:hypothetical protein